MKRNPLVDPQPGDIVSVGEANIRRCVTSRTSLFVKFSYATFREPAFRRGIQKWRRDMKNGYVVRVAEDGEQITIAP